MNAKLNLKNQPLSKTKRLPPTMAQILARPKVDAERLVERVPQTREQRRADIAAAQEFHRIKEFVAACRRQWPGAIIVLRPNEGGPPEGAHAPPKPESAPGVES